MGSSLSFLILVIGGFFYFPGPCGSIRGEMPRTLLLGLSLYVASAQALFSLFWRQ